MRGNLLTSIFEALRETAGGYFVLRDDDGEEYVIASKHEFDSREGNGREREIQLPLPQREPNPFEVADDINREIALYQAGQFEEVGKSDLWGDDSEDEEAGKRVRFEPLRGDLPPELQE
jgi:hypothetical protein